VSSILKEEPEAISSFKPNIPYLINRVIINSMQKSLERRYQSIREVRRELEDVQNDVAAGTLVLETGIVTSQPFEPAASEPITFWWQPAGIVVIALLTLPERSPTAREPDSPSGRHRAIR
jgi:hypothetical protein